MKHTNKTIHKIIIAQIVLYILLFFSFNNKTFFPSVILFSLYLFWLLEDWRQAAWITLVALLPFEWGLRDFRVNMPLPFNFLTPGREPPFLHFPISAKFLLTTFLLIAANFKKSNYKLRVKTEDFFLIAFLILSLFASFMSSNPQLAFISIARILQAIIIYYLAKFFAKKKNMLKLTLNLLLVLMIFEGILATGQLFLGGPFGRIIEESLLSSPYGKTAAEDVFRFRASGTFTDPNTMAIVWLTTIPLVLSQTLYKYPLIKDKTLTSFTFTLGFLGLISTFSRGVWLIFLLVVVGMVAFLAKKKKLSIARYKYVFLTLGILLLAVSPIIIRRTLSLQEFLWSQFSSGKARIQLMQEAWEIIKQAPILGVGPGNFLSAMVKNNVTGVAEHFLYPVHNLYLLFASEMGLPALLIFLIFLTLVIKRESLEKKVDKKLQGLKIGILSGIFAFLLSVLIYTGTPVNLEFFFLLLGLLHGT